MLDTSIQVKLDQFDGPLGLLLLLIENDEMDIKRLNLNDITKQYLAYLSRMQELNFDVAGDYLLMAATLLLIKSKSSLSDDEVVRLQGEFGEGQLGITSESELVKRLEEYQHFQKLSSKLWELPKKGHEIFVKSKVDRKSIINSILTPVDLSKLTAAMIDIIQREKRNYTVVKRDRLSIKGKLMFLKDFLNEGDRTDFDKLLEVDGSRVLDNMLITFISILELSRLQKISIFQNEPCGNIYLDVLKSLKDFDIDQADGFDEGSEEQIDDLSDIVPLAESEPEVATTLIQ